MRASSSVVQRGCGLFALWLLCAFSSAAGDESCCPDSAWSELQPDASYVELGNVEKISADLEVYRVGNASRAVIWNYDIHGFDSGRSRQLADQLAARGFLVVMPDYYRGKKIATNGDIGDFIKEQTQWTKLRKDWTENICPYVKGLGAKAIGAIGTCWGSYMVVRLSSFPEVMAGVSMHPSHTPIMKLIGEDEREAYEDIRANSACQLMMPSGAEPAEVKPGGLASRVLGGGVEFVEFPSMRHGWTTRGDVAVPEVDRDVKAAMEAAAKFFDRRLG